MTFRRMTILFALALCATFSLAGNTQATTLYFHADLDGSQEVPPNLSTASGMADLTLDDITGALTITSGSYLDLASAAQKISLNIGAPGVTGPFILPLFTNNTPGMTTGTFSGGPTLLSVSQIADMVAGNTYININNLTPGYTLGEIRGQLLPVNVPEPSTMALGAIGLCSFLVARRWKRRKVV